MRAHHDQPGLQPASGLQNRFGWVSNRHLKPHVRFLPGAFRQCGADKLAQCRLGVFPQEINTKTDPSRLGEQWVDDGQN
jgi:hypothetical protein